MKHFRLPKLDFTFAIIGLISAVILGMFLYTVFTSMNW